MAKVSLDAERRLKGEYGWSGKKYRALMNRIVAENHGRIARSVGSVRVAELRRFAAKAGPAWKQVALPNLEEVIPKRSVAIRKAAVRGKLMTDAMRDDLSARLKATMERFQTRTGEPNYTYRIGQKKGRMNPKLTEEFRREVEKAFRGYVEVDPKLGMPPNIATIAVTETRSVVNDVKSEYFRKLAEKNPDVEVRKRWVHNAGLSDEPRPAHRAVDGKEVGLEEDFELPVFAKEGKRWVRKPGKVRLAHPHDPRGEAGDVINCHCDCDYIARRRAALTARGNRERIGGAER